MIDGVKDKMKRESRAGQKNKIVIKLVLRETFYRSNNIFRKLRSCPRAFGSCMKAEKIFGAVTFFVLLVVLFIMLRLTDVVDKI